MRLIPGASSLHHLAVVGRRESVGRLVPSSSLDPCFEVLELGETPASEVVGHVHDYSMSSWAGDCVSVLLVDDVSGDVDFGREQLVADILVGAGADVVKSVVVFASSLDSLSGRVPSFEVETVANCFYSHAVFVGAQAEALCVLNQVGVGHPSLSASGQSGDG